MSHPALVLVDDFHGRTGEHTVAPAFDELGRGVCACGELVRHDAARGGYVPDRMLRLLVLSRNEARHLAAFARGELGADLAAQLDAQE